MTLIHTPYCAFNLHHACHVIAVTFFKKFGMVFVVWIESESSGATTAPPSLVGAASGAAASSLSAAAGMAVVGA